MRGSPANAAHGLPDTGSQVRDRLPRRKRRVERSRVVIDPGFSLAFLGAPGCAIYTDASGGFIASAVAGGGSSLSLPIPNVPALMGAEVSAQATAATSASGVLFAASNGLLVRIGS